MTVFGAFFAFLSPPFFFWLVSDVFAIRKADLKVWLAYTSYLLQTVDQDDKNSCLTVCWWMNYCIILP